MLRADSSRWLPWSLLLALAGSPSWLGCRHHDEGVDPSFPELVDTHCRSPEGCRQLLARLTAKREFCFREYGTADDRPTDCVWNDIYWWALKDHVELLELRERQAQPCADRGVDVGGETRELERLRRQLESERSAWRREQEAALAAERAWSEIDPKKCAIEGDEATCYQLVRYIALGDSSHRAEAQAALTAGQRIIDERRARAGGGRAPR